MSIPLLHGRSPPDTGQVFQPPSRRGALYPGVAGGIAVLLALALIVKASVGGISFASFLMWLAAVALLAAGGLALYWAWACATLRYELDRGVLTIRWGLVEHQVPVALLERVVRARAGARLSVQGLDWPGCHVGQAEAPRVGRIRVISLHRTPAEMHFLIGAGVAYAISVANPATFVRILQEQMEFRAPLEESRVRTHPALRALARRDPAVVSALATAAILALLATGIVFSRYAGFADEIAVNFPEESRVADRSVVLGIPLTAWALLLLNGAAGVRLAPARRTAAFTLLYGVAFVEALLVVAAVTAA
jgi:hypothetical protein